jgi:ASC-1-like (ASCH) protein
MENIQREKLVVLMEVEKRWFNLIRCGLKDVEGRKALKWQHIRNNDEIILSCTGCSEEATVHLLVKDVRKYVNADDEFDDPLDEFLISEGLRHVLPGVKSLKKAREVYLTYFKIEDIIQQGMVAIEVKVITNEVTSYNQI